MAACGGPSGLREFAPSGAPPSSYPALDLWISGRGAGRQLRRARWRLAARFPSCLQLSKQHSANTHTHTQKHAHTRTDTHTHAWYLTCEGQRPRGVSARDAARAQSPPVRGARPLSKCLKINEVVRVPQTTGHCQPEPCGPGRRQSGRTARRVRARERPSHRCSCIGRRQRSATMTERRISRWYFGGLASCGAACCTHPLDLLKVRG